MRLALTVLCALALDAMLIERASATQVCAFIVEGIGDEGEHQFRLNLSVDQPASVSVRFQGANFTSASMGGDMIQLDPGDPKEVDEEGFDVSPGEDVGFNVRLYDKPMEGLDAMDHPTGKLLATFNFKRKVGEDEKTPPTDLAAKQCKPLG